MQVADKTVVKVQEIKDPDTGKMIRQVSLISHFNTKRGEEVKVHASSVVTHSVDVEKIPYVHEEDKKKKTDEAGNKTSE